MEKITFIGNEKEYDKLNDNKQRYDGISPFSVHQ
jgi:hypothetical protein